MKNLIIAFFGVFLMNTINITAQEVIKITNDFDKIIVSPHIEAIFKKGTEQSVVIDNISVPREKFKYEIENGTLQVYLEGAKTYTKSKKIIHNGYKRKVPLYKNKVVTVTITYTDVTIFSLRGEEKITFKTPINQEECKLRIYGKSEVTINNIEVEKLNVTIYGESFLKIDKGTVTKQKLIAYGASSVMAKGVNSAETKITAYGDGKFQLNASKRIKVTSYGEATITYKGKAKLKKGIIIGESKIINVE